MHDVVCEFNWSQITQFVNEVNFEIKFEHPFTLNGDLKGSTGVCSIYWINTNAVEFLIFCLKHSSRSFVHDRATILVYSNQHHRKGRAS